MKDKAIIIIVLTILLISSISAGGMNIGNDKSQTEFITLENGEIDICVGSMTIYCNDDENACTINIGGYLDKTINPQGSDEITINYYFEWHIRNQKLGKNERWYFKMQLKKGLESSSPVIDIEEITLDDTLGGVGGPPGGVNDGTIYVDPILLNRSSFDKDEFWKKPETKHYRAELFCEYSRGELLSTPILMSDKRDMTVSDIELENQNPSKPSLSSNDISENGTGDISISYSFNATNSSDPDGDSISYSFDFHDGTVISNSSGIESHQWEDRNGEHRVTAYAVDHFGGLSEGTTMTFTLSKSKKPAKTVFLFLTKRFPVIARLFDMSMFNKFLFS